MAYVPMTRAYWATSAAGHVTVIDPRGPTRITDYVRNTRQSPRWNPWKRPFLTAERLSQQVVQ